MKMLNSLTLCFVSFLGGGLVGMGTVLFIQGAFYNENKIEEKRNQSKLNSEIKQTPIKMDNELNNEIVKEETSVKNSDEDKPKVNVDVDSIIVNDNVISDDDFFDDFFGDDN